MNKRLQLVFWIPVLWFFYHFNLLQAFVWIVVLVGLWEICFRVPWTKMTVVASLHMAGFLLILFFPKEEIWLLISTVVANDTSAYFGGKSVRSKELTIHPFPKISPKKTIGGYVCGILFGTMIGVAVANHFNLQFSLFVIFSVCIWAICGDLLESKFKRFYGIKDSGDDLFTKVLLCGHGGVYDRFDAISLVCVGWYFVKYLFAM